MSVVFNVEFLGSVNMPDATVVLFAIGSILCRTILLGRFRIVENMKSVVVPADHPHLHFWYFHRIPVGQLVSACRVCPGVGSLPVSRQSSGMVERGSVVMLGPRGKGAAGAIGDEG